MPLAPVLADSLGPSDVGIAVRIAGNSGEIPKGPLLAGRPELYVKITAVLSGSATLLGTAPYQDSDPGRWDCRVPADGYAMQLPRRPDGLRIELWDKCRLVKDRLLGGCDVAAAQLAADRDAQHAMKLQGGEGARVVLQVSWTLYGGGWPESELTKAARRLADHENRRRAGEEADEARCRLELERLVVETAPPPPVPTPPDPSTEPGDSDDGATQHLDSDSEYEVPPGRAVLIPRALLLADGELRVIVTAAAIASVASAARAPPRLPLGPPPDRPASAGGDFVLVTEPRWLHRMSPLAASVASLGDPDPVGSVCHDSPHRSGVSEIARAVEPLRDLEAMLSSALSRPPPTSPPGSIPASVAELHPRPVQPPELQPRKPPTPPQSPSPSPPPPSSLFVRRPVGRAPLGVCRLWEEAGGDRFDSVIQF
eukprot:TRINITY_DN44777_c0_g1_i1.p1 TRINITY_DN44777_c0_g1~~TRINITY_DN44777_c0_g1_i1.p1  ORF type:complete len:443 (+),score=79.67 TRINITY_DN44777_c0_g1_i1:53-1330(+)